MQYVKPRFTRMFAPEAGTLRAWFIFINFYTIYGILFRKSSSGSQVPFVSAFSVLSSSTPVVSFHANSSFLSSLLLRFLFLLFCSEEQHSTFWSLCNRSFLPFHLSDLFFHGRRCYRTSLHSHSLSRLFTIIN